MLVGAQPYTAAMRVPKYAPLATFLAALPPETLTVTLTLPEIETLVGRPLPPSARMPKWWWNLVDSPQSQIWMDGGWRVVRAELSQPPESIVFARVSPDSTP